MAAHQRYADSFSGNTGRKNRYERKDLNSLARSESKAIAENTVKILQTGELTTPSGKKLNLSADIGASVAGTVCYRPEDNIEVPQVVSQDAEHFTLYMSKNTTLRASQQLLTLVPRVAALNFASAKHPGGGFLKGSRAQEESLARCSGLYACLTSQAAQALYNSNLQRGALNTGIYTDHIIYSPGVPVFKDEAVNAGQARKRGLTADQVDKTLLRRASRILRTAIKNDERAIVLGAWGCGVFKNSPDAVARAFSTTLNGFKQRFSAVVFAVPDSQMYATFGEVLSQNFTISVL